jgi:MYXO-CTERM domain-containing protein
VVSRPWLDHTVLAFQPRYDGIRVFNSAVKVRVGPDGKVEVAVTDVPPSISPNALTPTITPQEAEDAVEELWAQNHRYDLSPFRNVVLGLLHLGSESRLVYRVDVALGWKGHRHYVDALDGRVIRYYARVFHSLGRVYPENPVLTPNTVDATLNGLDDETGPDNVLVGWGGVLHVYRYIDGDISNWPPNMDQLALGDATGNFLYDATDVHPVYDDPFAEVNAYYHMERAHSYFSNVHGVNFTRTMYCLVNYNENGQPYNNAFFSDVDTNTVVMATGQGTSVDFGYEADVVLHEFGHYIVDEVAGLYYGFIGTYDEWGRNQMSGGLHEGLADYFSCTISNDGTLGEYSLAPLGGMRDLANNTQVCPTDMVGESHIDGEIVGGAAWEIREAIGASLTDDLVFGGLSILTPNSTFRDLAVSMETTAQALVNASQMTAAEALAVHDILTNRGMHDCGRYIDVYEGLNRVYTFWGFDVMAAQFGRTCEDIRGFMVDQNGDPIYQPGPFQFRVQVPADMPNDILHFNVQQTPSVGDLRHKFYVRKGEMVHYEMVPVGMGWFEVSVPDVFDHETEVSQHSTIQITLDTSTTPALEPGADIYFALGHQSCPITRVEVAVTWNRHAPQPDAGVDAETTDASVQEDSGTAGGAGRGGCNCRTDSTGSSGGTPLTLLFVLLGLLGSALIGRSRLG